MAVKNRKNRNSDPTMGLEDWASSNSSRKSFDTISLGREDMLDASTGQAVIDILTDSREDFGYYEGEANRYMTEALAMSIMLDRDIAERGANIRNARALAKKFGVEAQDVWRSMEDMEDVKDFGKRVWEGFKAIIKKIILAVTNLIKMIGNFIKGAMAKAQEFFYKKYANKIYNYEKSGGAKSDTYEQTIKMKSVSSDNCWIKRPDEVLYGLSSSIQKATGNALVAGQNMISGGDGSNEIEKIVRAFNISQNTNKEREKFFANGSKIVNMQVYGVEKPSKNNVKLHLVIGKGFELLAPGTLQRLSYAYKTAMSLNKMLQKQLGMLGKIEKADDYGYSKRGDDQRDEAKKNNKLRKEGMRDLVRACQFLSSVIISAYGAALSARMIVFKAAKKIVKVDNKETKKEEREEKNKTN